MAQKEKDRILAGAIQQAAEVFNSMIDLAERDGLVVQLRLWREVPPGSSMHVSVVEIVRPPAPGAWEDPGERP